MAIIDMTGREYLAAHAPEPPTWFCPVMPPESKSWDQFAQRYAAEKSRQAYFQWPWVWADGVLAAAKQPPVSNSEHS